MARLGVSKTTTSFASFDAVGYLDDEETITAYITAALEDPNPDVFLTALRDVARAQGMPQLAQQTDMRYG